MRILGLFLSVTILAGCASTNQPPVQANDPSFAPVVPDYPREKIVEDGSLFRSYMANSLYSDMTARRVGDIITITLSENTNASKSAGTSTSKDTTVDLDTITGLGGQALNIGGQSVQLGVSSSNDFAGDAATNQSNSLSGNISVTVVEVLPNDNLVIRGEKWLTLNHGDEYIRLTGIIRLSDISPENEVLSTKIANARIQYSGTGSFASAQEKGWLTKFFTSSWWPL
ncbi:flagellar L-ring protein precursor FlgH [Alteromonas sp. 76-1]|jgi:flagellar L-ring protein precursor FlgH|uniref:flagellar basal body L-ring protein FlgH n=1 Tax=Alteromonas TaxID=226 RepID=UPI000C106259|nr:MULTISPECIES: flagellar basal body L-ring protein FlgH [Alteromonas]MBO7920726.1 flagellar basal body L-ring protein FlgH [Alteromonas sp. K632G]MCQ8849626.1 flagellar basal body L-ring protein FlgH [Alteromonas stellipolaris]PHS59566.1 MAG: flagellar basal body L-ring protein FlgH [Alteromonas sp.]VEL96042.1 flagellar L-ring protein precursor FlgH [Alteromonas sp. 76-1]|tara:strand:- start:757 stop:1437 length:681 start_codon:yes stop_codon:yes gene_type:complete